jgi:hypothetical protein
MEESMFDHRKKILTVAVIAALGVSASAEADTVTANWTGLFTMLFSDGRFLYNSDTNQCAPAYLVSSSQCARTSISGTLSFDTTTATGSISFAPYSFFGAGDFGALPMTFQALGDGMGGPGTLVLGNMGFNWNGHNSIPISIVLDAAGFFGAAIGGLTVSQTISGVGAMPASDNTENDNNGVAGGTTYPIGPVLMATTAWNTTNIGTPVIGTNPSGTLPLVTDTVVDITNGDLGVGGSPMLTAPMPSFNANFDIMTMHVTSCTDTGTGTSACSPAAVPVPATVWLFGSGLAGLIGVARRKRRHANKRRDA